MRNFLEIVSGVCMLTCVVGLRQGDFCTVEETGQPGECLLISECPVVYEAAVNSILPQTCGYRGSVAIVCCPGAIYEGSNCTMKDTGAAGACTRFANCRIAITAANKGILPQKCAAGGDLVCCSDPCPPLSRGLVSQQRSGSKAGDYCIELSETLFPCHQTRFGWSRRDGCPPLIPGITTTTDFSHYGRLGQGESGGITWLWNAATLLSERWVVCDADTVHRLGAKVNMYVGLGWSLTPPYTPEATYSVTRRLIHPEFNRTYAQAHHNIALLQVDRQVTFTSRILPACLHTGFPLPAGDLTRTEWGGESSTTIQTTMETVVLDKSSTEFSWVADGVQDPLQFCGRRVSTAGRCEGWSYGAPLTIPNGARVACTNLLVGTATAYNLQTCMMLFIRVSAYIPWIESILWP